MEVTRASKKKSSVHVNFTKFIFCKKRPTATYDPAQEHYIHQYVILSKVFIRMSGTGTVSNQQGVTT